MWHCCKCLSAYKVIVGVNALICLFGLMAVALGSYSIYEYNDAEDNFFSKESYVLILFGGLLTIVVTALAIHGGRDPRLRPNLLFCYWCFMSIILLVNIVAFYYFRTFMLSIDRTVSENSSTTGKILSVIDTQVSKEFQDYILSTYTTCCTGCDQSIAELECVDNIVAADVTGESFCGSVAIFEDGGANTAECFYALRCNIEDLQASPHGLGQGCYTGSNKLPNFSVGSDTCSVLADLTIDGKPLVGDASNGKSCGGGSAKQYVRNFNKYFQDKYFLIAVPWGFSITLELMAWLAAVYLIMCYKERDYSDQK